MRGESAMHVNGRTGPPLPSWRHEALKPMLTIGAVVAPIAALATIVGRPPPRRLLDSIVVGAVGVAVPLLRLWPGRFAVRTALTMMLFYGVSVFVLATNGLVPGATLLFALTSIFGAIYFGRAVAFTMVLLGGLAFVGVGWAVTNAAVDTPTAVLDTRLFVNWVRVGVVFASIGTLLTSGVAFVIGRVEATARDLRVAYERLGLLHLRLESAKEEERRFLAHELHDELGQLLTALKMRLQTAARRGPPRRLRRRRHRHDRRHDRAGAPHVGQPPAAAARRERARPRAGRLHRRPGGAVWRRDDAGGGRGARGPAAGA